MSDPYRRDRMVLEKANGSEPPVKPEPPPIHTHLDGCCLVVIAVALVAITAATAWAWRY